MELISVPTFKYKAWGNLKLPNSLKDLNTKLLFLVRRCQESYVTTPN